MRYAFAVFLLLAASPSFADSNPFSMESSIYKIEVPHPNNRQIGFGTGVLVAWDKILTNCHIVKNPGWPRVVHRKTGQRFGVSQYYQLGNLDACVLVGHFAGTPAPFAPNFREGENIWTYGYPAGLPTIGQGAVKEMVDTNQGPSILLAAFCAPGSSGGPVLNAQGQLVGLNWGVRRNQNQCLCLPASTLRPYFRR